MRSTPLLAVALVAATGLVAMPETSLPVARADCVSSGGTTICSQGDVRGADTGVGPGEGPSVPYPCDLDWYCYDGSSWDLGLDIDVDPGPGRPDFGRPGRPGNRPGGGGGIGGGRR
jgi:hypothetical protein